MYFCISVYFHPHTNPSIRACSYSFIKSIVKLCFPFMFTSKMDTHTHTCRSTTITFTHTPSPSHPASSPSDELLSCLLDIGSMQPQFRPTANHRTMRRTSTSPACSAFAGGAFNRQPSENLGGDWLGGARRAGHRRKQKKAGEAEREDKVRNRHIVTVT